MTLEMTLDDLKDYRALKQEQLDLPLKISELDALLADEKSKVIRDKRKKLRDYYSAKEIQLLDRIIAVEYAIADLPVRYRTIMRLHYIDGLTWEAVADKTHYSERHVKRLHREALRKMSLNVQ